MFRRGPYGHFKSHYCPHCIEAFDKLSHMVVGEWSSLRILQEFSVFSIHFISCAMTTGQKEVVKALLKGVFDLLDMENLMALYLPRQPGSPT